MNKEKDKILRTLEHIAITFDKFGFSPTIPICTGHKDFNYLFRLEIDTIKELCDQQAQRIAELEEQLKNTIKLPCKIDDIVYWVDWDNTIKHGKVFEITVHIDGIRVHTGTRYCLKPSKIFLTYKEAEASLEKFQKEAESKLKELQGENE